jgi:5'-nucleotidase
LSHLLKDNLPVLVVSGINRGYNLADDVTYSGTVAAAMESVLLGVPAIAVSAESFREDCLQASCEIACRLVGLVLANPDLLAPGTFLNVNVPHGAGLQDVSITSLGRRAYSKQIQFGADPRGKSYFWIGGDPLAHEATPMTDCVATLDHGRISISPMQIDLTCTKLLATWRSKIGSIANA